MDSLDLQRLLDASVEELLALVKNIRGGKNDIDLCSIVNVKSGSCSENCKFCAQSAHHETDAQTYPLLGYDEVLRSAKIMEEAGVGRFSLVSSGGSLADGDVEHLAEIYSNLRRDTSLYICASHGLLTREQAVLLKRSGVQRYHHNLETGPNHFPKICSTHTYTDRINTIEAAKSAGMDVCSGGIFGLGEDLRERMEMALVLKELEVSSVPLNVLNPIKGTPMEKMEVLPVDDVVKSIAIYRIILPEAEIRFAGGRNLYNKIEQLQTINAGLNGLMVGNYLTTYGDELTEDLDYVRSSGFVFSRPGQN